MNHDRSFLFLHLLIVIQVTLFMTRDEKNHRTDESPIQYDTCCFAIPPTMIALDWSPEPRALLSLTV